MKNWSAGYELLRTYVRLAFWFSHKKVIATGLQNIPRNKPLIFAPNHQNALMDPLAIVCTNPHQTLWLARADIFKTNAARSFLKFLKMLPVYRIRDGKENLSNNEQIFAQVIDVLEAQKTIGLFPEAAHSAKRRMLAHKKAIPRIALDAEAKNNFSLDLQIIPVGIYYDHYYKFNRTLIVNYGTAIPLANYKSEYANNPQKALLQLRDEIYDRLCELSLEIGSHKFYTEFEAIRAIANPPKFCSLSKKAILNHYLADKKLIDQLTGLENTNPEKAQSLAREANELMSALGQLKSSIQELCYAQDPNLFHCILHLFIALFTLPVFAAGFMLNIVPFTLSRRLTKGKIKDIAFISTFNFVIGILIFPLVYLIEFSLIKMLSGSWGWSAALLAAMPFSGKLAYQLSDYYREVWAKLNWHFRGKDFRKKLRILVHQREKLIEQLS